MSTDSLPARKLANLALILLTAFAIKARAQEIPPAPSFEVSSVRMVSPYSQAQIESGIGNHPLGPLPSNRFTARHVSMDLLVAVAFGVDSARVTQDGHEMHGSQLYDVEAKVAGDQQLTLEQMRPLLQNLLKQRFGLAVHREEKLVSGYALTVAKNGPKLRPSGPDSQDDRFFTMRDRIFGRNIKAGTIAGMLERSAGDPVMDKTGLSGNYDIDLRYRSPDDTNSNLPDVFTAVQEQLGLKLVPAKCPVEYLVVDHVDRVPTAN